MVSPVMCRKRWGTMIAWSLITFVIIALCIAASIIGSPPLHLRIMGPLTAAFLLLLLLSAISYAINTSLYVFDDGLAVKFRQGGLKVIRWDNLEAARERSSHGFTVGLSFRFKSYQPWLSQFSDDEIRDRLAEGGTFYWLTEWARIDRNLGLNGSIADEIAQLSKSDPRRKMAIRMFRLRKEQGIDLVLSTLMCRQSDLVKIENSYVTWVEAQSTETE